MPALSIQAFPTIKIFAAGNKRDKTPTAYEGERVGARAVARRFCRARLPSLHSALQRAPDLAARALELYAINAKPQEVRVLCA